MKRRTFVSFLACLSLSFNKKAWGFSAHLPDQPLAKRWTRWMSTWSRQTESFDFIEQHYRQSFESGLKLEKLWTNLFKACHENGLQPEHISAEELHDLFTSLSKSDFRERRTINIDGWVLSETELLAAAVIARSQNI